VRSESLDDDPLVELGERLDVRRDAAAPRDESPRFPLAAEERLEPEDRLAPDERVALLPAEPDDRLEPVVFFAVEPVLRLARPAPLDAAAALVCRGAAAFVVFCGAAAFVFCDVAAFVGAFVGRDAAGAFVCPLLEPEALDDPLDVLLAVLRAAVAALREPPLRVLALLPVGLLLVGLLLVGLLLVDPLLVAFGFVCFPAFFVVATRSPFPGLLMRYPVVWAHNPCKPTPARWVRCARQGSWPGSRSLTC
jgi:hypothetical protein